MNAVIHYHPDGYTSSGPKLMGRNAAGEAFLRGFLTHSSSQEFWAQADAPEHAAEFTNRVKRHQPTASVQVISRSNITRLSKVGALYYPGPDIGDLAHQRASFGHESWSLCGITHTTASSKAMDGIASLLTAPVQPWDAVICTSLSVQDNVRRILEAQEAYLRDRLGISQAILPQLPIIPLGVDAQSFVFSEEEKITARQAIGIDHDDIVVLFMGRLSFHAKAHPLAMYQALEAAVQQTGKRVALVECGWFAHESIAKAFLDAARLVAPSIRVITLDGRDSGDRKKAWAAADIFCSLADNIQETFGLTPLEAMAAGLPVVASDWNGYKSTIRHEIDGFLVPTIMPQAGLGKDLALRHALGIDSYDLYIGLTCSLVAVDISATVEAFKKLFLSPDQRLRMGAAGRLRAQSEFDWSVIIKRYEELWAQLAYMRRSQAKNFKRLSIPWPARMDPFHAFSSYPTQVLTPDTILHLMGDDAETVLSRVRSLRSLGMVDFAKLVLPAEKEIRAIICCLALGPKPAREVIESIPQSRKAAVYRSLTWLIKIGVLMVDFGNQS